MCITYGDSGVPSYCSHTTVKVQRPWKDTVVFLNALLSLPGLTGSCEEVRHPRILRLSKNYGDTSCCIQTKVIRALPYLGTARQYFSCTFSYLQCGQSHASERHS